MANREGGKGRAYCTADWTRSLYSGYWWLAWTMATTPTRCATTGGWRDRRRSLPWWLPWCQRKMRSIRSLQQGSLGVSRQVLFRPIALFGREAGCREGGLVQRTSRMREGSLHTVRHRQALYIRYLLHASLTQAHPARTAHAAPSRGAMRPFPPCMHRTHRGQSGSRPFLPAVHYPQTAFYVPWTC